MSAPLGFSGRVARLFLENSLTPLLGVTALLLGLFAVLHLPGGPCEPLRDLGRQILGRAAHRTHAISVCALRAAAEGRVRARIIALLSALIAGERDKMLAALRAVLAIGSTSGRDIVAGIVLGFEAQLHHARVLRSAA
jgi:hypothetical protein